MTPMPVTLTVILIQNIANLAFGAAGGIHIAQTHLVSEFMLKYNMYLVFVICVMPQLLSFTVYHYCMQ